MHKFGDFTIFGFTTEPESFLRHKLPDRLGVPVKSIDFGQHGHFFFYSSYGDVIETDTVIGLKLGLVHSPEGSPLSTQQLLDNGLISPGQIKADELRGNGLLACFSKTAPEFSAYKTLLSMPQLYYSTHEQSLICTDSPRPHLALLDQVEISEEAMIQHFLFRYALGSYTYFRHIQRLLSGQQFNWQAGQMSLNQIRDLRPKAGTPRFDRIDAQSLEALYNKMSQVTGSYIKDIRATGYDFGNMLSGGVDSSLIQLFINDHISTPAERRTFSYVMRVPEFEFEVEYAREASQLLQTNHTFIDVQPEAYPDLLIKTIETLGYPIPAESQPCKLAIAEYLSAQNSDARFFFVGTGADTLHGTTLAKKITMLDAVRHMPLSDLALKSIAALANPVAPSKAHGLRQVANMVPEMKNPYSFKVPANIVAVYTDIDMARRSFGDEALKQAFKYRHVMEAQFLDSSHHVEKVHAMELVTDAYETAVLVNHLYLAHQREQVYPYLDEETIGISYAFNPNIRYLKGQQVKPLLKKILEEKSLAGLAQKRKGPSVFSHTLHDWMRDGSMREMLLDIERPGFLNQADFNKLLEVPTWTALDEPNWFLWNLLTFDIFKKQVVQARTALQV